MPLMTPALIVSVLALLFTLFSFWWLWGYKGKVKGHPVGTYAASYTHGFRLCLPIVLSNAGARTRVVVDVRVVILSNQGDSALKWQSTRSALDPKSDNENGDFPTVFTIAGRSAEQRLMEFVGELAEGLPQPQDYTYRIDVLVDDEDDWTEVHQGVLRFSHMQHPDTHIVYSNSVTPCSPDEAERTGAAMLALAKRQNLTLRWK